MSNTAIEVITSVQRRRRWSAAEKERLVAGALEPGASVSAVARAAGIHPSQLYGLAASALSATAACTAICGGTGCGRSGYARVKLRLAFPDHPGKAVLIARNQGQRCRWL
jgi:hypothetical protein